MRMLLSLHKILWSSKICHLCRRRGLFIAVNISIHIVFNLAWKNHEWPPDGSKMPRISQNDQWTRTTFIPHKSISGLYLKNSLFNLQASVNSVPVLRVHVARLNFTRNLVGLENSNGSCFSNKNVGALCPLQWCSSGQLVWTGETYIHVHQGQRWSQTWCLIRLALSRLSCGTWLLSSLVV